MFDSKKIGFFLFSTKIMNGTFDSAYIICCVCGAVPFDGILQCCREKKNLYKSFYIKLKRFAWRNLLLFFYFSFVGFVFFSLLSYFNFDNRRKPGKTPKKKKQIEKPTKRQNLLNKTEINNATPTDVLVRIARNFFLCKFAEGFFFSSFFRIKNGKKTNCFFAGKINPFLLSSALYQLSYQRDAIWLKCNSVLDICSMGSDLKIAAFLFFLLNSQNNFFFFKNNFRIDWETQNINSIL